MAQFTGHADIRTTELYFVRKEEDAEVAAGGSTSRHGTQGQVSPSVAVLKFLAAERAGGERNGGIRWNSTYTTPKTGDRLPFDPKGERP